MKKLFFTLVFLLVTSFGFANEKIDNKLNNQIVIVNYTADFEIDNDLQISEISRFTNNTYDCTYTTGTQIVSNGEVIYEETNSWTITGMSCEEFINFINWVMVG